MFKEHSTWIMLEKAKQEYKDMMKSAREQGMPTYHSIYMTLEEAHNSIVKLQLELENKLIEEDINNRD